MPPKRKRPPTGEPPARAPARATVTASTVSATAAAAAKRSHPRARITAGAARAPTKPDPDETPQHSNVHSDQDTLREQFISLVSSAERQEVSNRALKTTFGEQYIQLVPIINDLTRESRLVMSKVGDELYYTLVSEQVATKFTGLDLTARMVYQVIEKAGNIGIWTKDIRTQTNVQQQSLNKIFKVQ
jgi:DNA-directed RNA polymerase III subunit RPC6